MAKAPKAHANRRLIPTDPGDVQPLVYRNPEYMRSLRRLSTDVISVAWKPQPPLGDKSITMYLERDLVETKTLTLGQSKKLKLWRLTARGRQIRDWFHSNEAEKTAAACAGAFVTW